ncbi:response regulator transcription factor [Gammaproteobacteria bacterium]|jgi:two-component system phosphate regulon response regulator PhoB|nr:response regulator transcription factor [Gammaproteobacteria bacterium]MDA9963505.1 response regulator transcription factor [Gammaproteobacteria bacterium]MDB0002937.1 response regulator transcription factor [Gammaproteobacteria bacterium]MDB2451929.1 response regulator transcription factor [Gammaproteobacteria bacterium]MDB2604136.1 response regulator transcription factor [Gammaproteobacteria bacterium]
MSQKILIIEDEPDIRKTLEYNISREGYKVVSASSLSEGKEQINSSDFSLILLDLMLPDGSGLDLCREIKSDKDKSSTPIIILTAKDDEVDKVVGFELGADDYVTKPFSVRELILRIKAILKRGESKKETLEVQRQFGELTMDIDSHEVFVNSEQIILTALEFRLLRQLVDRRGRVQSREQLLSDVWGYSAEVTTRTVDTHIKRLREKLGTMGKYVQTIRGVGYKFSRTP